MVAERGTGEETWIGAIRVLDDGRVALAWVRWRDEWLADAAMGRRGEEIAKLAAMYRAAVQKRGHAPDRLVVGAPAHAQALREALGAGVAIDAGFDTRARELSDAAAAAVEAIFGAEAQVSGGEAERQRKLLGKMHGAVEAQVAANDPRQVASTLERLQRAGMTRPEAIHAMARVLMHQMQAVLTTGRPFDNAAYVAELRKLGK